ncbi:MAG: hypothetical protein ACKO57_07950, partial [Alphaproteobacteria bacterium]
MPINVATPNGLYTLSRLAGSDGTRAKMNSIFSQAQSNENIYQQFQTVLDRIAPPDSFDSLSSDRQ